MSLGKYWDQGTDLGSVDPIFKKIIDEMKQVVQSVEEFEGKKNAAVDTFIDEAIGSALKSYLDPDYIGIRGPGVFYFMFDQTNSDDLSIEDIVKNIATEHDESPDEVKEAWAVFLEMQAKKIRDHIKARSEGGPTITR